MGNFRKGKILVIAILMIITSFFAFTGKVNATTVRRLDYDVHSLLEQTDCPSNLNITLIAEGKDITSVFDYNTFMANESCTKLLLPSTGKFGNFGDYTVTKKVGKNEVKYGIQGWYDNPEFNGDPVDFINFNPKKPVHRTFYAKMAPTMEDLHLDDYDMNGYTVLGKTYDVTAFNRYYTYGYSEDNTEHLYNNSKSKFYDASSEFENNNQFFKIVPDDNTDILIDHTGLYAIADLDTCESYQNMTLCWDKLFNATGSEHGTVLHISDVVSHERYYEIVDIIDETGKSYGLSITATPENANKRFYTVIKGSEVCRDVEVNDDMYVMINRDRLKRSGDYEPDLITVKSITTPTYNPNFTRLNENGELVGYNTCATDNVSIKVRYNIDPSLIETEKVTVYFENGDYDLVDKGSTYTLPSFIPNKSADVKNVRFKYQDGTTSDTTQPYTISYAPNKFVINDIRYETSSKLVINEDTNVFYLYDETITGDNLPTPTREHYTFGGWYTASVGGELVTDISKAVEAGTLYAHWVEKDKVTVVRPDGITITLDKGSEFTMPDIPYKHDETMSKIKLVYNDGTGTELFKYVTKHYEKLNIYCKETGEYYNVGETIVVNQNMTLTGNYSEEIIPAVFPNNLERDGYEFLGWFDSLEGGAQYSGYSHYRDLVLYAHWVDIDSAVTITYPDGCYGYPFGNHYCPQNGPDGSYVETAEKNSIYKLKDVRKLSEIYMVNFTVNINTPDAQEWGGFHNGFEFSSVVVEKIGDHWIIDGQHYNSGQKIVADRDMTAVGDYATVIIPIEWPEDPTAIGYKFLGWYNEPEGGYLVTEDSYDYINDFGIEDYPKDLYAHWEKINEEYTLPAIPAKNPETISTVTLKFKDDLTNDKKKYVKKNYTAIDYTVNGGGYDNEHFNVGDKIVMAEGVTITPNYEEEIIGVDLYSATRDGYMFAGWYDEEEGGNRYYNYSGNEDITLYAHWTTDVVSDICRRATTLHTSGGKTYGNLGTAGTLVPGDAFDCDVNGDGVYDPETERFYYINDLWDAETDTFVESTASLVYYADYYGGPLSSSSKEGFVKYGSLLPNDGPNVAAKILPTTDEWSNVSLYKTVRQLSWPNNSKTNSAGNLGTYDYSGYSARMIHGMELFQSGCLYSYNNKILSQYYNLNNSCEFLTENTRKAPNGRGEYAYWIESPGGHCPSGYCPSTRPSPDFNKYGWELVTQSSNEFSSYMYQAQIEWSRGVRPVIDVPKTSMQDVPEYTIYHTITYPEGQEQVSLHGSTFVFGDVNSQSTISSTTTVTFNYNDGETEDYVATATKLSIPTAYKIGNTRYDKGSELLVLDDYQLEYIYVDTSESVVFPNNPIRDGYTFVGWFDSIYGGNEYTSYSEAKDITLYARWNPTGGGGSTADVLCRRATTLHQKECETTSGYLQPFCNSAANGYGENGSQGTRTITYGNLGISGELHSGDAFDCDVNGDGLYDSETERFYYVSDYYDTNTKEFNNDYAALIYDSNMFNDERTINSGKLAYNTIYATKSVVKGPTVAATALPSAELWNNISLKDTTRQILTNSNNNYLPLSGTEDTALIERFSYEGYAARMLTIQELKVNCSNVRNCNFFGENTQFDTTGALGFWLESLKDTTLSSTVYPLVVYGGSSISDSYRTTDDGYFGIRPVIDVPKSEIEIDVVTNHTVTLPDKVDTVPHETPYTIPKNKYDKEPEDGATITFKYNNGHEDTTVRVQKTFIKNGFTIDGDHYDSNEVYVVLKDIELIPDYTEEMVSPEFPVPTKGGYTFDGWFDENEVLVETYTGTDDITLYAHWTRINPEPGLYVLPENNDIKEDATYTVTFKPENGDPDSISTVIASFEPDGWLVDGKPYAVGDEITVTENTVIEPNFKVSSTIGATFPENPTKTNYTFEGWYDRIGGGYKYTSYDEPKDFTLYAHWGTTCGYVNLGDNNISKDPDILATVTFKYHNGQSDTTSSKQKNYTPNGWKVDYIKYTNGQSALVCAESVVVPDYKIASISNPEFPEKPLNGDLTFTGWFTEEVGGEKVTSLDITEDITLHAHYEYLSYLDTGKNFNSKLVALIGDDTVSEIREATLAEYNSATLTEDNIVSIEGLPTYLWRDNDKILYYSTADTIYMNENANEMFQKVKAVSMDLTGINTSRATKMNNIFYSYLSGGVNSPLEHLNISTWDTSNVTEMENMFGYCKSLQTIDLSNFNTSKVTSMYGMFGDAGFTELDISPLDTSNVTNMSHMFSGLKSLEELDVSTLDTSKVTDMSSLFGRSTNLERIIGYENFDTSNVTNMKYIFYMLYKMKRIDISNWETSKVTDMHDMFRDSYGLEEVIFGDQDFYNVRNLGGLFYGDYMLTTLDVSMFDTSNVYDMSTTFSGTYSGNTSALTTIYASDKWVTTKVSTNSSYRLYTFSNDVNLVGGAGTIYDPNHVDCDYAHIDGGLANPGYFTEKAFSGHYTIFFPDYRVSPIYDGEVFTVPQNTYTKDNQILSTVTFDYQDGRPDYTSQVYKKFTPAGWTADNRTYSANTNITVHKDYVFEPRYTEGTVGATFPEDPVREGYTFLGWYTVGGTKYTSYTGTSDRTLYARWAKNENVDEVTITYPDGSKETVPVGTEITLPKPIEKEDDSYPVTFKPENGEGDIIKYATKSYIGGWSINVNPETSTNVRFYEEGSTYKVNYNTTLYYYYLETITGVTFPENPTRTGYNFTGWYDRVTGGTMYTSYNGENDLTLYAQYSIDKPEPGSLYNLGVNNIPKADTTSVVTFKYQDSTTADTTTTIVKQYVPNGWLVDGQPYADNSEVVLEEGMVIEPNYVETVVSGEWPTDPTWTNYTFQGWFDSVAGGNKYTINDIKESITLYAHWYFDGHDTVLCKRRNDPYNPYTEGVLDTGDEFECDVDGDGNYEGTFYYVSDYYDTHTNTFNNEYAAMIYSSNIDGDQPVSPDYGHDALCYATATGWNCGAVSNGPTEVIGDLPTISQWSNTSLYQVNRNILTVDGSLVVENFSYNGYAARLLTVQEINEGCGLGITSDDYDKYTYANDCGFLSDHLQDYVGPTDSVEITYYLENPIDGQLSSDKPLMVNQNSITDDPDMGAGARPVIDVPKDRIFENVKPANTYTVTYADGHKETVPAGTDITIPENNTTKPNANGAKVTFKPENGGSDIIRYVTKKTVANGYTINNTQYDSGSTYTVNSDITLKYAYREVYVNVVYPNDIIKAGYDLDDWYTEANGQGEKVSSYNGTEDKTLYANWTKKTSGEYTLPENTIGKDPEDVATVTFVYNNGKANTTSKVVATYAPNGWLVDGVHKDAGEVITMTPDTVLEPNYVRTISPATFPANPTKTNYTFMGWVDVEDYNSTNDYTYYTSYDGEEDLTLYAKWETDANHCSITYSDGEIKVVTCGTSVTVPSTINTDSETITFNYMTYWYDEMMDYTEPYETSFNRTFYTKASIENYKIGNTTYNPGESFTVDDDIYVERTLGNATYDDEPFEEPDEAYNFVAWFTDWSEGVQVKSYYDYKSKGLTGELYGHYTDHGYSYEVTVDGSKVGTYDDGYSYTAPAGTNKDEDLATVTLINGETTNTYKVHRTGSFSNYKVEKNYGSGLEDEGTVDAGNTVTINAHTFLTSQYDPDTITGVDLPVLESNEYTTFKGWYKNENGSGPKYSGTYTDAIDITLYAVFEGKSANVDYVYGNNIIASRTYKYGDTANTSDITIGDTFAGNGKVHLVYQNGTTANDEYIPLEVTKEVDHWLDGDNNSYNVTYTVDFVGSKVFNPVFGNSNVTTYTLPTPDSNIYPGYNFAGWYTEPQGGSRVTKVTEDRDITVYAHWTRNNDPVCVYTDGHTEECNPGDSKTVPYYNTVVLGHVYEIANGIGSHYDEIVNTLDITRYDMIQYYEIDGVRYKPGDTYEITDNQTDIIVKYTDSIRNSVTLDGTNRIDDNDIASWYDNDGIERSFAGWYTDRVNGDLIASYDGTDDLYVYAHCIENSSVSEMHEVTYNKLDNSHYTIMVPHNTVITIEPDVYEEPGIFYLDPNNGDSVKSVTIIVTVAPNNYSVDGAIYHAGDQIRVTKDISITSSYENVSARFIPDYPDPVKEGYIFTGWYDGDERVDYKNIDAFNLHVLAFKTLVAHYEEYNPATDVIVDFDGEIRVVPKGTTENLPTTGSKTEDTFGITFDTQRGLTQTISVNRQYTLTGYTVNGDSYNPGAEVTYNVDTTVRSQYDINCSYAQDIGTIYPELPSLAEMYSDFVGWYDAATDGNLVEDASNITDTITLYARYLPKYRLTIDGVTTEVPEGYIYTVPTGSLDGDSITFTLNYNYPDHDAVTEDVTIARGKGVVYQLINGDRYDVNETYIVMSDTVVTSVTNNSDTITMIPEISTPTFDGYFFVAWVDEDRMNPVDIYKLTPEDKYYDGRTLKGFWEEDNINDSVTVTMVDDFAKSSVTNVTNRGMDLNINDIVLAGMNINNEINSTIHNNINSDVINMTIDTTAPVTHFLYNGVRYEKGDTITLNEDGIIEIIRDVNTTIECDGSECPSVIFQKPNTSYNEYTFQGIFDEDDNLVDISKIVSYGSPFDDRYEELLMKLVSAEDTIILTVDNEVSIIPKGMGTIPDAKTKASDVYKVTYDYNDGSNKKVTDNIVTRYSFEHYYVVGKGEFEAGAEYNYLENTTMNSVFTRSVEYPEMRTIKTENFVGWYTEPHGGVEVTTLEGINKDTTLYARYNNEHVTIMIEGAIYTVPFGEEFEFPDWEDSHRSIDVVLNYDDNTSTFTTISSDLTFNSFEYDGVKYYPGDTHLFTDNAEVKVNYDDETTFSPEYVEPESTDTKLFIEWQDMNGDPVDVPNLTGNDSKYHRTNISAIYEDIDSEDDVVVTYDGEQRVVSIGTKLSELGDSPIKPSNETFTLYIDRNNGTFIIDTYEITKSYDLDKVYINGEELTEDDYTFNEDTTVTTSYTASYEPNIFEGLTSDISGIFTEAVGGVKVENYDNVNDGDTLYYQYGETHTITVDGEVIATVPHGSEYTLPVNTKPRNMENIATVTFDYGDGRDPYVTYVRKRFNSNGWSINGEAYANNEMITVNEDIVLDREYYETIQGIEFPGTPKRSGYRFNGWYYNDEEITSYDGTEDITITADWIKQIIITYLDDGTTEIVDAGTTKVFEPVSDTEEVFHNITFKYNYEGSPEDKVVRISSHGKYNGWIINNTDEYNPGEEITFNEDSTVEARYEEVISNKNLPEDPVREGYDFLGWYNGKNLDTSSKVDITKINKDMTVYGQYKVTGQYVVFFDGEKYTYDNEGNINTFDLGYASEESETRYDVTLDYQDKVTPNRVIPTSITNTFVKWTDENDNEYSEVINLTYDLDGMHFTSHYDEEEFENLDLSTYNPDNNNFIGWYTDRNNGELVTIITEPKNITLYAHYQDTEIAIITVDNEVEIYNVGDTYILPSDKTKEDDEIVITFDPQNGEDVFTKTITTSYTFDGYRLDTDNILYQGEHEFTVEGNMTFNSEYTSNTIGDTWPSDPEKENYIFLGWFTNQTSGIEVFNFDGFTQNSSLYAHYTTDDENFVTLTNTVTGESLKVAKNTDWVFGDSKFNKDKKDKLGTITYKFNSAGYPDEVKDYYRNSTITGYYIEGDDTLYSINDINQFTTDTSITPEYDVETDTHVGLDQFDYEVTNGDKRVRCFSKTNQTDPYDLEEYTCYTEYNPEDGDVTLYLHWKEMKKIIVTEPDGTTTEYDEGDTYNTGVNDSTKDSDGYTVTFKYQDGTTDDTTQSHMTTYTANGWLINGEHVNDNTDITLEEDIVKQYDYTETSTTITLPEPTRDDYTFVGWNSRANGKGTTYDNDSINALDKDTTVYAIWTKDEINITFVENGGSDVDDMTIGYNVPIGDLPTTSKENERITEGDNNIIIGYIFDGWYRDPEFTSKVSSTTTFTDDTTLYAKFIVDEFPYVYPYHEDSFVCTGSNYIDTGVKLYTNANNDYLKDYEVGFTIESYTPRGQVKQAVFFNAKWEVTNLQWPGVAFRRKDETNGLELSSSAKKTRVAYAVDNYSLPLEVRIYRIDNVIYLSTDGGVTKTQVQDTTGFSQFFDVNSYFCAGDNGNGGIQRYVKGTISNYYIKLGDYQGTVDDVTTHTVTYPDNSVETYGHNSIIELDANESTKADELGATVTFDYNDGVTPSEIRYNTKAFTPNGFIVNDDTHYDDNSTLVVDEDKVITYDYISETDDVEFPDDPTRKYYVFDGWYTEDGDKVEYYDGAEDITLYAHWTRETVNIIYPDETITVDKGEAYILRTNDFAKADDNAAEVTFKYHDDETEDLVRYVKYHYTAKGWSIDGTAYADEASITPTTDITVTPEYTFETIDVEFPDDPTYDNHEFEGWFTEETGGIKLESYDGTDDIILHAQWSTSLPTDFDLDSDDVLIVKGDTHQIEVTFTPDGSTDTLTYTSSDDAIATVDTDGLITGVETGVTTIMVSADNADIDKIITVTVVSDKLESEEYDVLDKEKDDESKDRIVIGAEVKTLISEFKDNMTNPNEYIKIYDAEGNEVSEDDTVKTGLTIKLEINGRVYDEAIMIVRGDIDGDGLVDVADEAVLTDHILRITPIDDYRFYAADVDEDSILDVADDSKLTDFILRILDSLNE